MDSLTDISQIDYWALLQVAVVVIVAAAANFALQRHYAERPVLQARMQILQALLLLVTLITVLTLAPIGDERRGQLLSLVGIVLSAAIALSSTTVLGNAIAGLMLRSIKAFKPGDYLIVGDHAGRVTELDLLHTEIQTEDSDLTTLSNIHLVTHPYRIIRTDAGTIISATVSLGYDVPRDRIEKLLIEAATNCGLADPFVQVLELGDFSVNYRIAGMLRPAKGLISTRSRLRAAVLDALHGGDVEIVSPNFMNTRALAADLRVIPQPSRRKNDAPTTSPDDVVFEKAEQAESLESMRQRHKDLQTRIEALREQSKTVASEKEAEALTAEIEQTVTKSERLGSLIEKHQEKLESSK